MPRIETPRRKDAPPNGGRPVLDTGRPPAHGPNLVCSPQGWLGLEILQQTVDWQLCLALGDGTVCVRVEPGSPAKKVGIRTGDYCRSVNGMSLETFNESQPAAGSVALLKMF